MKKFSTIFLLFLLTGNLFATDKGGTINGERWSVDDSPIHIINNITVINLTIDPGVTILFDGNYAFNVTGFFKAVGTAEDSIIFNSDPSNSSGWTGLNFNSSYTGSEVAFCSIQNGNNFGIQTEADIDLTIRNSNISNNDGKGVYIKGMTTNLFKCTIANNVSDGVIVDNQGDAEISNCIISNNNNGIYSNNAAVNIKNSVISYNSIGLYNSSGSDIVDVFNSTIVNNAVYGIYTTGGAVSVKNSIIYYNNNSQISNFLLTTPATVTYSAVQGGYTGMGNIGDGNEDPNFEDTQTFRLLENSFCIDAGDPDISYYDLYFPPSHKTAINDMGAYGGPDAGFWYEPLFVTRESVDFGKVRRDSTKTETVTVKNYGDSLLTVPSVIVSGVDSLNFSLNINPFSLNPRDSLVVSIDFTPDATKSYSANLDFLSNSGKSSIPLSGVGVIPQIHVAQNLILFGEIAAGDSGAEQISIFNIGQDTLEISNIAANLAAFSSDTTSGTIAPGGLLNIHVIFMPDNYGNYDGILSIYSNDPDRSRLDVTLRGTGLAPNIAVTPDSVKFGNIAVNDSLQLSSFVQNSGNYTLRVDSIGLTGPDADHFTILNNPAPFMILESGQDIEVQVKFLPDTIKEYSGSLEFYSNDPDHPMQLIQVTGTGIAPSLTTDSDSLIFGNIVVDRDSMMSVSITNEGNTSLVVESTNVTGANPDDYTIVSGEGPFTLESDNPAHQIVINFHPVAEGLKKAQLDINSNDPFKPVATITFEGMALRPDISVAPDSLDFGTIELRRDSVMTVTVSNIGANDLEILATELEGEDAGDFSFVSGEGAFSLPVGSDPHQLLLRFAPAEDGEKEAVLKITSNDHILETIRLPLNGRAVAPAMVIDTLELHFGTIPIDSDTTLNLIITNTGSADLFIDSTIISGLAESEYSIIQGLAPFSVQKNNGTDTIAVKFSPVNGGERLANLTIVTNDPENTRVNVLLNGKSFAVGQSLIVSDHNGEINFGDVLISLVNTQEVNISNYGTNDLEIDSVRFSGPDKAEFLLDEQTFPIVLTMDDDPRNFKIHFSPLTAGQKTADLLIYSNDTAHNPFAIPLSGSGKVDETPANFVFNPASVLLTTDSSYTFQISITDDETEIESVDLCFRRGGESNYQRLSLTESTQDTWSARIDGQYITSRGLEYYFEAVHGGGKSTYPENGSENPAIAIVSIPAMNFTDLTLQNTYQKISFPANTGGKMLKDLLLDDLGEYDNSKYRLFDWDQSSESFVELTDMNKIIQSGKALWLITKEATQLDLENCSSSNTGNDYSITLKKGWNMIGNPFAFRVEWAAINTSAIQGGTLNYFNGSGWEAASDLQPFKGYAVYALNDTVLNIPAVEAAVSKAKTNQVETVRNEWHFQVKAAKGKYKDEYNYAGARSGALDERDRLDILEPPVIGDYVSLYFESVNENDSGKFAGDFRRPDEEGYSFDFRLVSNFSGTTEITVDPVNLPEYYEWILVSPESKIIYPNGIIQTDRPEKNYRLVVGTKSYLDGATADFLELPVNFKLSQNYPNPFNPETSIRYEMPGEGMVSVDIYDILGRRVKNIYANEFKEAGYHKIIWDGSNNTGQKVASGIYFLHLKSGQYSKTIKMILQR
ncbi:MAG: choice-of-anchor D domain-containing protein [Calditrichaceae bacterium]